MSSINISGFTSKSGANFSKVVSEKLYDVLDYEHEKVTSTSLKFSNDAKNYMAIGGSKLKYTFDGKEVSGITSGTITSFKAVSEGQALLDITKLSLAGKKLSDALDSGSTKTFLDTLLSGNDVIKATKYADTFWGGTGNDTLYGYAGNDRLEGGAGADKLHGGAGADTFVFRSVKDSTVAAGGRDTIVDFSQAEKDRIDLKAIDADTTLAKNQAFSFIADKAFSKDAGELRYEKKDGDTFVHGDVDGDGKADFSIRIDASIDFTKADFIL